MLKSCFTITFVVILSIFLFYWFNQENYENTKLLKEYDFIIVGAGAAGSVVANRLSENPKVTVLLLEAGEDQNDLKTKIPGATNELLGTEVDWKYKILKRNNSFLGSYGLYPRGKTVGGSTSINWMAYVRGNQEDFNSWKDLGNEGWGYDDVLPYFKKSEKTHIKNLDTKYHNTDGIWDVHDTFYPSELTDLWLKAGEEVGYGINHDYNGEKQEGVARTQQSITPKGVRASTSLFVYPFLEKRKNFYLVTKAQVNKILFEGKTAVGVELSRKNKIEIVKAKKEVILSAGAINTPKILLLSGVGPKSVLDKHKIQQIIDLPVGKNLQDHPQMGVEFNSSVQSLNLPELESYWTAMKYMLFGKNELAQSLLFGSGFFHTKGNEYKYTDIQIHFLPLSTNCEIYTKFMGSYPQLCTESMTCKNGFVFVVVLLHEKSRGSVTLKSSDPNDDPIIDLNFFDHPDDMNRLIKGIRIAETIANSTTFKGVNLGPKHIPWIKHPLYSDEYYKQLIETWGSHLFHPVGTCKMGPDSDKEAVVNTKLQVRGLERLRVIDASIMPHITSGNTAAPSVMIGEKGSDFIKQLYKL